MKPADAARRCPRRAAPRRRAGAGRRPRPGRDGHGGARRGRGAQRRPGLVPQIEGWGRARAPEPAAGQRRRRRGAPCAGLRARVMTRAVAASSPLDGLRSTSSRASCPMPADVVGRRAPCACAACGTTRARVEPGDLFVARARRAGRRRALRRATRVARGASAVLARAGPSTPSGSACPLVVVDDAADGARLRGGGRLRAPVVLARGRRHHRAPTARRRRRTSSAPRSTARSAARAAASSAPSGTRFGGWRVARRAHDARGRRARARRSRRCARAGATHVAMEVSSHRARSSGACARVRFRVAALTNLTQDHLDFHGSMEAYAEAKARLFTELGARRRGHQRRRRLRPRARARACGPRSSA